MFYRSIIILFSGIIFCPSLLANYYDNDYGVIQLYTQDELNVLVANNQHLQRVQQDDCQLVQDIEAHALKVKEPTYVYLWGDMLAWGVCVKRDAPLGMYYIKQAANQGLLPAIEQLGRYYEKGILVQQNKDRAIVFYREAAMHGFFKAKVNYIRMLNDGYGSPVDYEDAYKALFHTVIANKKTKRQVEAMLAKLALKMPGHVVKRAKITAI